MNIVHLPRRFTRSHWGGTETYVLEVSKQLLRRGHATSILCPNALSNCDAEVIEDVPVRRFPYFYPYFFLDASARRDLDLSGGSLFSFDLLRELYAQPALDLIHLHTGRRPGAIGRYVAMKRRIPYVVTVHGGMFDRPAQEEARQRTVTGKALEWGRILGWWVGARRVMEDAAAIVCVGMREYREVLARYPRRRVVYMPNGVDATRFRQGDGAAFRRRRGIDPEAQVLLTMGRIDPQKNQKLLLEILPRLREKHPRVHLVVIGHVTNAACHEELTSLAAALPPHCVTIIPGVSPEGSDLVDAYHAADCFVLPSTHEPFGIVILEAWAAGLPVVASAVGGIPGFVHDGTNGLLCPSDDRDAFTAAISRVLDDCSMARELAAAGQKVACDDYSWERVTRGLIDVYQEVVRENSHRK